MHELIKLKTKMSSLYACFGKAESTCKRRRRGYDLRRKMVIVGDGACGKTCLVTRMAKGQFVDIGYIPTVFDTEMVTVTTDTHDVELAIFDTAGQEDYDRLRPFSYYDVDIVLICFSLDDQDTLTNVVENWSPEIRYFCGKVPVILVGNKLDLRDEASRSQGKQYCVPGTKSAKDMGTVDEEMKMPCNVKSKRKSDISEVSNDIFYDRSGDDCNDSVGDDSSTGSISLTPEIKYPAEGDSTANRDSSPKVLTHSPAMSINTHEGASSVRPVSELYTGDLGERKPPKTRFVSRAQGVSVAKRIGAIAYFETSALSGSNVSELLTATASAALMGHKKAKKSKSLAKTLHERELMPSLPLD